MTGSGREGCCWKIVSNVFEFGGLLYWRDVGDRFRSGRLLLENCGRQFRV
jgi:hypothetical protein